VGEIRSVVLPGVEGDMTVLAGQAPLVAALHPGIVFATDVAGTGRRAFVRGAIVEVTAD
jgi:F-type H+-transporting ATPase subunit epsilon